MSPRPDKRHDCELESARQSGRATSPRMTSAAPINLPAPSSTARPRGIPPLPLLTVLNYFNYLDRQVVYGMTDKIGESFSLTKFELGWLAFVNLMVFALASLISGPIADRIGPRKVIFTGVVVWSLATIGSAMSHSFSMLLFCRAVVGVGEGRVRPQRQHAAVRGRPTRKTRSRPRHLQHRHGVRRDQRPRARQGAGPRMDWHTVFWIAGGPSILLAACAAFVAAPARLPRPARAAGARVPPGPDVSARARGGRPGDVRCQRAHHLVAVADHPGAWVLGHRRQRVHGCRRHRLRRRRRRRGRLPGRRAQPARAGGTRARHRPFAAGGDTVRRRDAARHRTNQRSWC